MQRNNKYFFMRAIQTLLCSGFMIAAAQAATPLWTFEPLTATTLAVPPNSTATVQYQVTNQSSRPHTLTMQTIRGIVQTTAGLGICGNPFVLRSKDSCTLSLQINGSQLNNAITDGPVVCQQGSANQCYRPSSANSLRITQAPPTTDAVITVTGSPLALTTNGPTGQLTINNISSITATNITSSFTGTALDGNVTETGNTCANLLPGNSCTLTYTPGNTVVAQTDFPIQGTNTNTITAAISIQPGSTLTSINPNSGVASGGTGVTLTGTGLTGATALTFDGVAATSVHVVNSTTVTAVTPAHTIGVVDVVITTPAGSATLTNGYTYVSTAVGLPSSGGIIACLNVSNNLIAATADIGFIQWGGFGTTIGAGAQSDTDGAGNTTAIIAELTTNQGIPINSYAAGLCSDFAVDSQGNSPCQAGNTCYNDWFLPAGNNATASGQLNCLFDNRVAIGGFANLNYWSSTEDAANTAWVQNFNVGVEFADDKSGNRNVRCVRTFTP